MTKTDLGELKRKSVRGGMATMASQGFNTVIQLTSTVVLARMLSPADYGIMVMVTSVTAFSGLFADLGLSTAVIQKRDLTHAQHSNMFWLNVFMGLLLTLTVAFISPLVAWFYQKPEVLWVTVALSATFLIGSFGTQHSAMLVREMSFGRLFVANLSGAVTGLAVSITLATMGFRYWSLVWGTVCGTLCTTIILSLVSPFRPGRPSRGSGVRGMLKFGAQVTAFNFANYFHRNLDNLLIGRYWGTEVLGLYSRGYSLLMFPINNLRGPINTVALPALSRLQNEPDAFRAYYCKITSLLAFLSMPLTAFLFVASHPIIELALGKQWLGVAPIFAVLAAVGFIHPVLTNWGVVLLSLGQSKRYLHVGILNTFFSALGFVAGLPWGARGVAIGYALSTYLCMWPILALSFKEAPVKIADFLRSIWTPLVASCAAVGILSLGEEWSLNQPLIVTIIAQAISFIVLYGTCILLLPGGRAKMVNHLLLFKGFIRPERQVGVIPGAQTES